MQQIIKRGLFAAIIGVTLWRLDAGDEWQSAQRAWHEARFDQAVAIWQHLREEGDLRALVWLARAYEEGAGVGQDSGQAMALYQEAARKGEPSGQYRLAEAYLRGSGVPKNLDKAYHWMELAALGGDPRAQLKLGVLCLLGVKGMPEWEKGKRWLVRAASGGNRMALYVLKELARREKGQGNFVIDELDRLLVYG